MSQTGGPRLGKFVGFQQPQTLILQTLQKADLSATRLRGSFMSGTPVRLDRNNGYLVCLQRLSLPAHDYKVDGKPVPLPPLRGGQFLLLNLNEEHVSVSYGEVDCISIYVSADALQRFHEENGLPAVGSLRAVNGVPFEDDVVKYLGESLLPAIQHPQSVSRLFVDHMGLALLSHLSARYGQQAPVKRPRIGGLAPWQERRAKEMLLARIDGSVGLDELAASCELSRSHFTRAFKTTTGSSPLQWLLAHRIERAKRLLLNSRLPIERIAEHCGFADQSHFTRTFVKFAGDAPGRWRRLNRA